MPGIWVYNFIQIFVIGLTLIAHRAGHKISQLITTSITAGNLIRGRSNVAELADYWSNGPKKPAHSVTLVSKTIELVADAIVICSSISFSWEAEQSLLEVSKCQPPLYNGSEIPFGINVPQFIQGDIDYAEVYNYGLPLKDGLLGGWSGWPMDNPMNSFEVRGEGPVYVVEVFCDNGKRTNRTNYDIGTHIESSFIEPDDRSLFLQTTITFPANSVYDDISQMIVDSPVDQMCSCLITLSYGDVSFHFDADQWAMVTNGQLRKIQPKENLMSWSSPTSVVQHAVDVKKAFSAFGDKFGVLPIITEALLLTLQNQTYFPSQGASFCNMLSEGTYPDGYYHTQATYRGIATAIGASAHFSIMQYGTATVVDCEYFGYAGSGLLNVPDIGVWLSTGSSIIACLAKLFEILWWAMAQSGLQYFSYRRARRSLRNPMRFAIDAADMFARGLDAGRNEQDVCDLDTTRAISELGAGRIQYGDDLITKDDSIGRLMIGEYGQVKTIVNDRQFGTIQDEEFAELDELLKNGAFVKFMTFGRSTASQAAMETAKLKQMMAKIPFLHRAVGDGRDELFQHFVLNSLHVKTCNRHELVIKEGEIGNEMYFILHGKFDVLLKGKKVATLTDGAFFGELALALKIPRAASVQSKGHGKLYVLNREAFQSITEDFSDIRLKIDAIKKERLEELQKK
ncbi:Potassium/sodium hyperpolarization-activated cyclic nucleotide-gated channel 3 [Entophlyctis luteolus]|nr:Potassium/sodium hyperpolarization-activated cyclic nucleotide-gated channel 3 [Entophlyctis luteolus]